MVFFAAAFGLLLHIVFWGAGLAVLFTPRPWRRYWPIFAGLAGIGLQSASVWAGVYAGFQGTHDYAWWAELLPVGLLLLAWKRHGAVVWTAWRRLAVVVAVTGITLGVLSLPFASATNTLTTQSLGSCDAADYAAGARVLGEFARTDRDGFVGLTEVVHVQSVNNFFDYWIRLNHFTPPAIVALNAAVVGLKPYQLISAATVVFFILGVPVTFWLARSGFRYGPTGSVAVSLVYGFSPILWYAVAHNAMSQLLVAPAIALLTWAGVVLWRTGAGWGQCWRMGGLLSVGYWVVLGSYNFMVLICLVPVVVYATGLACRNSDFARLGRWSLAMLVPLAITAVLAFERVAGLAERFELFEQYDFGWKIPGLTPEGWYGFIRGVNLAAYPESTRWVLGVMLMAGLLAGLFFGARRRDHAVYLAACTSLPILAGYLILQLEGRAAGTNTSYDAYKLFASFYPGILVALAYGVTGLAHRRLWIRGLVAAAAVFVIAGNVRTSYRFTLRLADPPLIVDRGLARLQTIESSTDVKSVNMMLSDFWARLWANSFLLHRAQFFPTHTYEARLNTPLRGEWDLLGGIVAIKLPELIEPLPLEKPYSLVDARSQYYIRCVLGDGWYDSERLPRANLRWRWTKGDAVMEITNPHPRPLNVGFRLQARGLTNRDLQVWVQDQRKRTVQIGTELSWVSIPSITIPPGQTSVQFRSSTPPQVASATDSRLLGFAAYGIEVEVKKEGDPAENEIASKNG